MLLHCFLYKLVFTDQEPCQFAFSVLSTGQCYLAITFSPPLFLFGNWISLHSAKLSIISNQDSLVAFGIKECFTRERCVDTRTSEIN